MREGEPQFEQEKNSREKLAKEIQELFEKEGLSFDPETQERIEKQVAGAERYINALGKHMEGDGEVERFVKIPVNDNPEIDEPFKRQVDLQKFLKKKSDINIRGVISSNTDREEGTPYAVIETLPSAKIGFITGDKDIELLRKADAKGAIQELEKLHEIDGDAIPEGLHEQLRPLLGSYEEFFNEMSEVLDKEVIPLDLEGDTRESLHQTLNRRFQINDFKEKALHLIEYWKDIINSKENEGTFLVHGDLTPNNIYVGDDNKVEFLDWEWSGVSKNKLLGTAIDLGTLRSGAWNNKEFREALDHEIIEHYKKQGKEKLGRAYASLSILYSHIISSGFFENYDKTEQRTERQKRRRESTEADIVKAWEIAGLEF